MRNLIRASVLAVAVATVPWIVGAQDITAITGLFNFLVNWGIGFLIAVAILVFFVGIIKYLNGGPEQKAGGMKIMLFGIIGLFVMLSIYGLVLLLQRSFGINSNTQITPPTVPLITR